MLLAVKSKYDATLLALDKQPFISDLIDILAVKMLCPESPIYCVVVYVPPHLLRRYQLNMLICLTIYHRLILSLTLIIILAILYLIFQIL